MPHLLALVQMDLVDTHRHQRKHGFPRNPDSTIVSSKGGQPAEAQAKGNGPKRMLNERVWQTSGSGTQAPGNLLLPKSGPQLSISEYGIPGSDWGVPSYAENIFIQGYRLRLEATFNVVPSLGYILS